MKRLIEANAKLGSLARQIDENLAVFKRPLLLELINTYEEALRRRDEVIEILVEESQAENTE